MKKEYVKVTMTMLVECSPTYAKKLLNPEHGIREEIARKCFNTNARVCTKGSSIESSKSLFDYHQQKAYKEWVKEHSSNP